MTDTTTPPERIWLDMRGYGKDFNFVTQGPLAATPRTPYVLEDLTGWRSMDSAPKDGTPFLSCNPPFQAEVAHVEGKHVVRFRSDGGVDVIAAKFWMPLPTPPEARP